MNVYELSSVGMAAYARASGEQDMEAACELVRQLPELSLSQALFVVRELMNRDGATV